MNNKFAQMNDLLHFDGPKIVTVGLVWSCYILQGKRRDNGKWTNPGGHIDEGEDVLNAACREVFEETGIEVKPSQLEFIGAEKCESHRGGKSFALFTLLAHVDKEKPTPKYDTDEEFTEIKWVEVSKSTPELMKENRHAYNDRVMIHLGINEEVRMSERTLKDVSEDIKKAGIEEEGEKEDTTTLDPGPKSAGELQTDPEKYLPDEEVTGD